MFTSYDEQTEVDLRSSLNKRIKSIKIQFEQLKIELEGLGTLIVWDAAQSCCESRYMVCDDKLDYFVGSVLLDVCIDDSPNQSTDEEEYGGEHQIQFLNIRTTNGVFTVSNHNVHNGYYGGFDLRARLE